MANQPTPLQFTCYNCGKENTYSAVEGKEKDGAATVIKRCTTCSKENKVELPAGWVAPRTATVYRGMKPD